MTKSPRHPRYRSRRDVPVQVWIGFAGYSLAIECTRLDSDFDVVADTRLERDVAVKILPASSVEDPAARARLLREAVTASQLNHPNICTIHEVGDERGRAFIAMELVPGQPLSARLHRGPLAQDEVVRQTGVRPGSDWGQTGVRHRARHRHGPTFRP